MHESDIPEPPGAEDATEPVADPMLDGFEEDLDNVAAALDALDADDLDTAEALSSALTADAPAAEA